MGIGKIKPIPGPEPIPEPIEEPPVCPHCNQEMIERDFDLGKMWYCGNTGHVFTYILSYERR